MAEVWHARAAEDVAASLDTHRERGLDPTEAARRLERDGRNEIAAEKPVRPLAIVGSQFRSLVVWVLIVAAVVSALLGEWLDSTAILAIVVLNAAMGFAQG